MSVFALGFGLATLNKKKEILEVFYPEPLLKPTNEIIQVVKQNITIDNAVNFSLLSKELSLNLSAALEQIDKIQSDILRKFAQSEQAIVVTLLDVDNNPTTTAEVYLKLQLLSTRLLKPHSVNLTGMFGILPNVAWTDVGAIDVAELKNYQLDARIQGKTIKVYSVDKFPCMADYIVPLGVRIADASRVRLGAYLGEGTTVMHEGFVNFNAGSFGPNMVEGRISAGVTVGKGTDLGGSSSTMGTLSGGGNVVISLGENCLLGANAGTGIPLGDKCTIESGLYITAGTKVSLLDDENKLVKVVKARDLSGQSNLLFRRNSQTGTIECITNKKAIQLNDILHKN